MVAFLMRFKATRKWTIQEEEHKFPSEVSNLITGLKYPRLFGIFVSFIAKTLYREAREDESSLAVKTKLL